MVCVTTTTTLDMFLLSLCVLPPQFQNRSRCGLSGTVSMPRTDLSDPIFRVCSSYHLEENAIILITYWYFICVDDYDSQCSMKERILYRHYMRNKRAGRKDVSALLESLDRLPMRLSRRSNPEISRSSE